MIVKYKRGINTKGTEIFGNLGDVAIQKDSFSKTLAKYQ